ncbi:metallophosphoesterase [Halomicronema hongdechloris C2206]|uniref:Metallophosphoesterase n=1 Tax=Halomicronema hongdechloris C2206 TaxID=1641165 RepID=A0A1Z3HN20_9CYAN|nr:metallophosphoesterase [Halomicronema hongdechloris]ASC71547.1 metallophosphoesterase [Halomicronema hongdechloris C2206]
MVFSDINSRYGSTHYRAEVEQAVQVMTDWQPDLILCAGDMVAGQSLSLTQAEITAMWAAFDQKVFAPLQATGIPFGFTLGNHDASSSRVQGQYAFAQERQLAAAYWRPRQDRLGLTYVDRAGFPFYYSFQQNDIFYLVWDASSATVSAPEIAWADRSLASTTAQRCRRRIVMGHLPLYAVSQGRDRTGEFLSQADRLQTLLERHNVHSYICGHHHAYYPAGSGPRTWLGRTDAAMQTLTVLDMFFPDFGPATTVYTTYDMGTRQVIELPQLPRQIVGPNGRLLRHDLTWSDLSQAEKNQPYVPSRH